MAPSPAWVYVEHSTTPMQSMLSSMKNDNKDDRKEGSYQIIAKNLQHSDTSTSSIFSDDTINKEMTSYDDTKLDHNEDRGHKNNIEHSFSQSDLSRFHIRKRSLHSRGNGNGKHIDKAESDSDAHMSHQVVDESLRADFVHLYGLQLHKKGEIKDLSLHHEERDGFEFRSIFADAANVSTKTVIVIPSIDLDRKELMRMCNTINLYEERQLYHLFLTNDPSVRIIYLTTNPVCEKVVGYYLSLCQDEHQCDATHCHADHFAEVQNKLSRVLMVNVPSPHCISLSDKILEERKVINFLKDLIHSPFYEDHREKENTSVWSKLTPRLGAKNAAAGLCVFTGSDPVDKLSQELGIRLLEASGDSLHYGTKQGSREIFEACGVPFPAGTPDLSAGDDDLLTYGNTNGDEKHYWAYNHRYIRSANCLAIGIARQILRGVHPKKWMIKLNQGFSGKGNASIDLQHLQEQQNAPADEINDCDVRRLATKIEKEFETNIKLEDKSLSWFGNEKHAGFKTQIERLGVIAEAFIEGEVPTSPSIQAVIEPEDGDAGRVSIVSTHEQLLKGQVYYGCINPASDKYRGRIMEMGLRVGKYLAARGVVGHFSVDFLATNTGGDKWDLNAVEVNLRQGGTTHPQAAMSLLCGGCICSDGVFRTNNHEVRCYIATDCHEDDKLKRCNPSRLIEFIECRTNALARKIHWNKVESVGVVFHLFGFLESHGRIGFTAIGRTSEESRELFNDTIKFLDEVGDNLSLSSLPL